MILESVSRLREAFDYLALLPLSTADGLLRSIQPLLKLSPTLRDGLVIVLRKAIFSRYDTVGHINVHCLKAGRSQLSLLHGTEIKAKKGKETKNINWICSEEMINM